MIILLLIKMFSQYCVDLCICVIIQTVLSSSYLALLRFFRLAHPGMNKPWAYQCYHTNENSWYLSE